MLPEDLMNYSEEYRLLDPVLINNRRRATPLPEPQMHQSADLYNPHPHFYDPLAA